MEMYLQARIDDQKWCVKDPHLCAVLSGLWTLRFKWVPFSFFRLFCTGRTCSPKPGKAPVYVYVGSKSILQSRTRQGSQTYYFLNH